MNIVIYHNANCSKSRQVLEILLSKGIDPVVINYLDTGWTRPHLLTLFAVAGITAREALRESSPVAEELGLSLPTTSDESIVDAMLLHPELVNRPIVCSPKGISLCRPVEKVLELI